MFMVGREEQLKVLNGYYVSDKNNLTVLYGRRGIGKTALIRTFAGDKRHICFNAAPAADFDLLEGFRKCVREQIEGFEASGDYADIFRGVILRQEEPVLFVFEEFQNIVRADASFMGALAAMMRGNLGERKVMVILASSSVLWVENSMVKAIGDAAYSINAFLKLKELSYADTVAMFPEMRARDLLYMYAVTGGVPRYLAAWDGGGDVRSNICRLFLEDGARFREEAELFVKEEFRETGVYRTILGCLAAGMNKLNDIHAYTGYGRDKISVYLNNLIGRELAEKIFSYESGASRNVRKGLYRIKDDLTGFWFRFVYPYYGLLERAGAESFYDRYIGERLDGFALEAFIGIAAELMQLMNDAGRLAVRGEYMGRWYGKAGDIHIIYGDGTAFAVGQAYTGGEPIGRTELEELRESVKLAGINAEQYFLFSAGGFDGELEKLGGKSLMLIGIDDL
ncbi:MAG: ATP-binding protein [Butyrivibrio sp.]|nr:ATP-binding protein [Butyrivibrio sp.]